MGSSLVAQETMSRRCKSLLPCRNEILLVPVKITFVLPRPQFASTTYVFYFMQRGSKVLVCFVRPLKPRIGSVAFFSCIKSTVLIRRRLFMNSLYFQRTMVKMQHFSSLLLSLKWTRDLQRAECYRWLSASVLQPHHLLPVDQKKQQINRILSQFFKSMRKTFSSQTIYNQTCMSTDTLLDTSEENSLNRLLTCNLNSLNTSPVSSWKFTATVSIQALSVFRGSST